jgi:hypothetical protein
MRYQDLILPAALGLFGLSVLVNPEITSSKSGGVLLDVSFIRVPLAVFLLGLSAYLFARVFRRPPR